MAQSSWPFENIDTSETQYSQLMRNIGEGVKGSSAGTQLKPFGDSTGLNVKVPLGESLVRGHYYCPIWNSDEQHWWTTRKDGTIYDPTKDQFPSRGNGIYTPFSGIVNCAECGKPMKEEDALFDSRYAFCSGQCRLSFVGL